MLTNSSTPATPPMIVLRRSSWEKSIAASLSHPRTRFHPGVAYRVIRR
jgi:hypothetical protein